MMNQRAILDSIDERLNHHAALLQLDATQKQRARALAYAGAIAGLVGLTPKELFDALAPAFERYLRIISTEREVQ